MRDALFSAYVVACNALMCLPGHRFRLRVLRSLVRAQVAEGCAIERRVRITTRGQLTIGEGTNINRGAWLDARGGLTIGRHVNVSPEAALLTADHDVQSPTFVGRARPVVVGDRSWIASRAIVLPGSSLGEGVVVAAGAVVRGIIPPRTIVAGNPATRVGERAARAQTRLDPYRRFLH